MKILITGANGQLGTELIKLGANTSYKIIGLSRAQLNIASLAEVKLHLHTHQPDVVINTAAYTKVDLAEKEVELAYEANVNGVVNLATSCNHFKIPLIHISTDYIFDGSKSDPYQENDNANPLGVYGQSKWLGEIAIRQILSEHLILRVSWVYGLHGNNFVKTMIRLAKERESLKVVNDQKGCPTSTKGIASFIYQSIKRIAERNCTWGTYHFCEGPETNWYEFANSIISTARNFEPLVVKEIIAIPTSDYPTPATRPANSVLTCKKLVTEFNYTPHSWHDRLPEMIRGLY